jgi:hypothetical protein
MSGYGVVAAAGPRQIERQRVAEELALGVVPEIQGADAGGQVVFGMQCGAVPAADRTVHEVAFDGGCALDEANHDAAGVDQGVVQNPAVGPAVDIDAIVGTEGDEVRFDRGAFLLDRARVVTAAACAGASAAQGQPDAPPRCTAQQVLAKDDVALETVVGATALHESAVADAVALGLDEVADEIAADRPAAGRDEVEGRHGVVGLPGCRVGHRVALDPSVVGKAPVLAIHLDVGVEVEQGVVAGDEIRRLADHVKGVFALRMVAAHAANRQILEAPERRRDHESLDDCPFR